MSGPLTDCARYILLLIPIVLLDLGLMVSALIDLSRRAATFCAAGSPSAASARCDRK